MAINEKYYYIGIIIIFLVVTGMFIQKSYNIFSILPAGQYRANSDCTFITNVAGGSLYYESNSWISIKINGIMHTYGEAGYSSFSCTAADAQMLSIKTIEGYDICKRTGTSYSDRIYIAEGTRGVIFKENYMYTSGAITSCSQTCQTDIDTNCNNIIDRTELGTAITNYIAGTLSRTKLGIAIQSYVGGTSI